MTVEVMLPNGSLDWYKIGVEIVVRSTGELLIYETRPARKPHWANIFAQAALPQRTLVAAYPRGGWQYAQKLNSAVVSKGV